MWKMTIFLIPLILFITYPLSAQSDGGLKLPKLELSDKFEETGTDVLSSQDYLQPKKRKTVNAYVGAGYSFVIFTSSDMNTAYPVFDTRKGDFLSEVNLYFGFAVARAVTLEFEPSILFTSNDRILTFQYDPPITFRGNSYRYVFGYNISLLAFPFVANVRFFPAFQSKGFGRLIFIGGGVGATWIREEYDHYYGNSSSIYYADDIATESTSQWRPVFRLMAGATGTGGQFGFGGELRYNIIPLSTNQEPFITRTAKNMNSVDLTLRFYFSL
jgi:hypothetical protein